MSPELKVELKRLRKQRFYYLTSKGDKYLWMDRDGKPHQMLNMRLDHLQACIRLVRKDMLPRVWSSISNEARLKLEPKAFRKLKELKEAFSTKAVV